MPAPFEATNRRTCLRDICQELPSRLFLFDGKDYRREMGMAGERHE